MREFLVKATYGPERREFKVFAHTFPEAVDEAMARATREGVEVLSVETKEKDRRAHGP